MQLLIFDVVPWTMGGAADFSHKFGFAVLSQFSKSSDVPVFLQKSIRKVQGWGPKLNGVVFRCFNWSHLINSRIPKNPAFHVFCLDLLQYVSVQFLWNCLGFNTRLVKGSYFDLQSDAFKNLYEVHSFCMFFFRKIEIFVSRFQSRFQFCFFVFKPIT